MNLGIIDYGVGNIANVIRAFNSLEINNLNVLRLKDSKGIKDCDKLVLPGVGAFGVAMENIIQNGFLDSINEFAKSGKYILGICLGMQLLFDKSYEFGNFKGLGLIQGEVIKFGLESNKPENVIYLDSNISNKNADSKDSIKIDSKNEILKIPHIGWNLNKIEQSSPIFTDLSKEFFLYFVHSYHAVCDKKYILASCDYGVSFPSIVCKDNIFGIQPHPEKSHKDGLKFLENFVKL
ncbi:imidazole glycerol phosphate synthase subunit HisH [Helicobacter saguini]|uniref:Imidazole glycerol phosphate synthase subunit HisH n=1 Tax=Helicobacter saguini TaxID=1548018 RepID=A0A347VSE5_9HELI|nr:imidazole glycerol phosphate synthase subunit HisH [Helicobacter saguini]MWV62540.1 imidazole glycerol phosphate synthase subunit HisH [Helicobacter saguini]MWV66786.1 imidazole glycerol phosphate synthase subunit HisH [Helicobacter saguini]MWV69137.1 imidazole glycerol phosphate synthase subunit HisH [Helicobacter saguini]MWV71308.1 imidazole glycerol phosphate synthase subunit HisH [Helicobacter saguini]TLD94181.1 imidazole glycerol phosphate synthase subunit HisH [Helicobacter saguini]